MPPCPTNPKDIKKQEWREELGKGILVTREPDDLSKSREKPVPKVTLQEAQKHCTVEDLWVIVEDKAFDLTKWVAHHPGGHLPIINMSGRDATDVFAQFHPASTYNKLKAFHVADIIDKPEPCEIVKDFRQIRQELLRQGLFETKMSYYFIKAIWLSFLFFSSVALVLYDKGEHVWASLIAGLFMGSFWQQSAFIGHDTGHNGITHNKFIDNMIGIFIGNTTGGVSIAWWKKSHNVHHITCNSIEHDPDIQHLPIMAISEKLFKQFFSTYHSKYFSLDNLGRFLVSYQHYLYYPVMCLARFNLYAQSFILLLSREKVHYKLLEIAGLVLYWIWYSTLTSQLRNWQSILVYVLVSHAVTGLLHVQITLSHFSMPAYHGHAYNDDSDEFYQLQIRTSMDVKSTPLTDWIHGGLQFQVEHHLYPRLPRHNLRIARDMVMSVCKKHGIQYSEESFWDANVRTINTLREAAKSARKQNLPGSSFFQTLFWDAINCRG